MSQERAQNTKNQFSLSLEDGQVDGICYIKQFKMFIIN